MSELKAYRVKGVTLGDTHDVYLKSEVDKVIAELEEKLKNSRNARKYWRKEYLIEYKECLHNKLKRCLAMAKLCQWKMGVFIYKKEKNEFYYRWYNRWLAIAEQFKKAK